ncbi:hypothetical protein ACFRJ9_18275 [Paenarthrobacter sp. NPDC056912]|uniref:hypothetical protein n=1 Tax=Paenarthrobacter sp. NPDC056912 TaxID=3345965 RepID=UPI00366C5122
MRWDSLFFDLESQIYAERALAGESEISERARVEYAGVELTDRLRGAAGTEVRLVLIDGSAIRGGVGHVGSEWLVLAEGGRQWFVPYASVVSYQGLGRLARKPASRTRLSLGIASALRVLARDRAELMVHLAVRAEGGRTVQGVIDRVGRDYFDLAVIPQGEARRAGSVATVMTIPFAAFIALCSQGLQDY